MTRPRQVLPKRFYLITRRCTQQQFLLRPEDDVNNAIAYCLAVAAKRHNIVVLLSTVESNHHHTVIYDEEGNCPKFMEDFHKLVARCLNRKWGRTENLWSSSQASVVELIGLDAILDKLAYTAANPVKDRLVERAVQWPGLNGYRCLLNQKAIRARRPQFFFRRDSELPAEISLEFRIPGELGAHDEIVAELRARVEVIERDTIRARAGARVLGVRAILKQHWQEAPKNRADARRSSISPRFAGRREARIEAARALREFLASYREARSLWLAGKSCVFPAGTYWMARFTPVVRTALPAMS